MSIMSFSLKPLFSCTMFDILLLPEFSSTFSGKSKFLVIREVHITVSSSCFSVILFFEGIALAFSLFLNFMLY